VHADDSALCAVVHRKEAHQHRAEQGGVDVVRGALDPIASNDSTAGRGRNRRVVITVLAPGAAL